MPQLEEAAHWFGSDLEVTNTGDIALISGPDRSRQRVLRRLMTVAGLYLSHLGYGAGLEARVGAVLVNTSALQALVVAQMRLEASVSQTDPIGVTVVPIQGGVEIDIVYVNLPDRQPVSLSFEVVP